MFGWINSIKNSFDTNSASPTYERFPRENRTIRWLTSLLISSFLLCCYLCFCAQFWWFSVIIGWTCREIQLIVLDQYWWNKQNNSLFWCSNEGHLILGQCFHPALFIYGVNKSTKLLSSLIHYTTMLFSPIVRPIPINFAQPSAPYVIARTFLHSTSKRPYDSYKTNERARRSSYRLVCDCDQTLLSLLAFIVIAASRMYLLGLAWKTVFRFRNGRHVPLSVE